MKGAPTPSRLRRAMQSAQAICDGKGVPLTRQRLAAQLGVSLDQLQRWACDPTLQGAAELRAALQEGDAQLLEYCLRPDVRHEQLGVQYLKAVNDSRSAEPPLFAGEELL